MTRDETANVPVLVVHGLWDSEARVQPLVQGLRARGITPITAFDLEPGDGRGPIPQLALQVRDQVVRLERAHNAELVDIVAFSMGALVSRYYMQRAGGRAHVRRFISISGPHRGTYTAYGLPLTGVRQMRPGSTLLEDLAADPEPFGSVRVHCIYTPFDLMIVPATSSILPQAQSVHRVPALVHRFMLSDGRVLDLTSRLLRDPDPMR